MTVKSLEKVKDEIIGKIGSHERTAYEEKLVEEMIREIHKRYVEFKIREAFKLGWEDCLQERLMPSLVLGKQLFNRCSVAGGYQEVFVPYILKEKETNSILAAKVVRFLSGSSLEKCRNYLIVLSSHKG